MALIFAAMAGACSTPTRATPPEQSISWEARPPEHWPTAVQLSITGDLRSREFPEDVWEPVLQLSDGMRVQLITRGDFKPTPTYLTPHTAWYRFNPTDSLRIEAMLAPLAGKADTSVVQFALPMEPGIGWAIQLDIWGPEPRATCIGCRAAAFPLLREGRADADEFIWLMWIPVFIGQDYAT